MGLIGHWRRSVLGAGGVALLLPLGLVLGVALTTALGGKTTLRALGQVFAGPAAPSRSVGTGLEAADSVPSVPVRARRPAGPASVTPGGTTGPGPSAPTGTDPSDPKGPPEPDEPSQPSAPDPEPPPAQPDPGTDSEPAPEQGSALNEAAQGAADAVDDVPVVGAITDDAMQTVVDLIP